MDHFGKHKSLNQMIMNFELRWSHLLGSCDHKYQVQLITNNWKRWSQYQYQIQQITDFWTRWSQMSDSNDRMYQVKMITNIRSRWSQISGPGDHKYQVQVITNIRSWWSKIHGKRVKRERWFVTKCLLYEDYRCHLSRMVPGCELLLLLSHHPTLPTTRPALAQMLLMRGKLSDRKTRGLRGFPITPPSDRKPWAASAVSSFVEPNGFCPPAAPALSSQHSVEIIRCNGGVMVRERLACNVMIHTFYHHRYVAS